MKKTFLFNCIAIGSMLPLALPVFADNKPAQMKELCRDHAIHVAEDIRREVFDRMNEKQYRQTESLIIDNCLRRFVSGGEGEAMSTGAVEEEESDWFTRYVLEGKGADKPGNRRLERMRRK